MAKVKLDMGSNKEVPPIGPEDARIAIIGEAPGKVEEAKRKPFVGSSGRLLNQMLDRVGIKRHQCYITNVVKRRPPRNNFKVFYDKSTPKQELLNARQRVRDEIKEVNPNITIALGKEAAKALLERESLKVSDWRGSVLQTSVGKVLISYHPAYIMRRYKMNPIMLFDLKKAKKESRTPDFNPPERTLLTKPTKSEVMEFLDQCEEAEYLSFDIETKQLPDDNWFIDCLGLAPSKDYGMCIPITSGGGESYWNIQDEIEILRRVADIMADFSIKKIAQNAQYDIYFLERLGIPINNLWFDTMNASKVVYPEFPKSLAFLNSIYTDEPFYKHTSTEERWIYNAKDATCTFEVAFGLLRDLKELSLDEFYFNHVHELVKMYIDVRAFGVKVDKSKRGDVEEEIKKKIKNLKAKLKELTGKEINVYSVNDMRDYIYHDLGMKKKTNKNGNLDTSKDVLTEFYRKTGKEEFKIMKQLRKVRSNKSTYIDAEVNKDGRMRTTYDVSGTETGRLSSKKTPDGKGMNLQNVDKDFRMMFVPDDGFIFLGADLSQAENRVVAYLCEDEKMIGVVEGEGDIHTNNAALIFDKSPDKVTYEERQMGKRITHGSNYRMGPITFAKHAEVTTARAKKLLAKYHRTYPRVRLWHKQIEEKIRADRTLTNPFGRKRYFNDRIGDSLFREATAYIPQSTVADALHRATLETYPKLPHPARIVMNLHDAFFIQVPDTEEGYEIGKRIMKESLERPFEVNGYTVSIPTEVLRGTNWKEVS